MHTPLPFETLLETLRDRGVPLGVREHLAVGRLLSRWDGTAWTDLRDALAALLGRNDDEVEGIRRAFDELYAPAATAGPGAAPVVAPAGRPATRWAGAAGVAAVAAAGLALGVLLLLRSLTPIPPPLPPAPALFRATLVPPVPVPDVLPPQGTVTPPEPVRVPPPTPPELPPAPIAPDWFRLLALGAVGLLLPLAWLWRLEVRTHTERWLVDGWRAAFAALPGPYTVDLLPQATAPGLPRPDVEDAASLLGRIFETDARTRALDVAESLRLTLRRGLAPTLVYRRLRRARPIVALVDTSRATAIWDRKVQALLDGLARQGVAIERWYFDGDPRHVWRTRHGSPVPLERLTVQHAESPLLVLSDGAGLTALAESGETAWHRPLLRMAQRAWLTPVTDDRLWPDALRAVPMQVWPMTRRGVLLAARDLAGMDEPLRLRQRALAEGRATLDDVERVRRLASLVPHPSPALLDHLRRLFVPDVPDAALAHLAREAEAGGTHALHLPEADLQRCVRAVRHETPRLEAAVRAEVLAVLAASEPSALSAAHLRWKLAVATQQVALGDLSGRDTSAARATLARLAEGPIWEEVPRALRLVPAPAGGPARDERGDGAGRRTARGGAVRPPGPDADMARLSPRPAIWPGPRAWVPALTLALGVCVAAWLSGVFHTRALAHEPDAFTLTWVRATPGTGERLEVRRRPGPGASTVDVYQDSNAFRADLAVPPTGALSVPLGPADRGRYYQVRAPRPDGTLALSNAVWVPSGDDVIVLVDAQPWARVAIQGAGVRLTPRVTPFRVALAPGAYTLSLENGGVTPPLTATATVTPDSDSLRYIMPGFDADAVAAELAAPTGLTAP
ncbi:MAG: hypothetical protein AB7G23_06145 [Vicinamibacterales bacterium]